MMEKTVKKKTTVVVVGAWGVLCFLLLALLVPLSLAATAESDGTAATSSSSSSSASLSPRLPGYGCVPFQGSPATAGKCDYVMSSTSTPGVPIDVFLQDTYENVDHATAQRTVLMNAFFPPECRTPLVALTCMGSFLRCQYTTAPEFLVFPPCRSVCEAVVLGCSAFFASQGMTSQLPDCDMIVNTTGTPLPAFPPDGTQCVSLPAQMSVPYGEVDCPYPLEYNYDEEDEFAESNYSGEMMCIMPCPNPMWTDEEWTGGITIMMIVAGCSFILGSFVLISMCMMPGKRRYPGTLFIYIVSCSVIVSFVVFFFPLILGGPTRLVCTHGNPPIEVNFDNAREHDGGGVPCIMQAIGIHYFGLAANFWWLALCINVFEMIFMRRSLQAIKKFHIVYSVIAWGVPFIAVIICLGATNYGALPAIPYCFIIENEWWSWTLFYFPIGISLIIGSILMTAAVTRMIMIRFKVRGSSGQTIEQSIRLMLLIVAYWLILVYPWAFRIYTRIIEDDLRDATEEQVRCSSSTGTECEASTRINVGSWYLMLIDLSCHGFVLFACLASTEIINFWVRVHKLIYTKPFREAIQEIRDMISGDDGGWGKSSTSRNKSSRQSVHGLRSQGTVSGHTKSSSVSVDDDSMDGVDSSAL